ncbi:MULTISPECIES: LysR family transcriptional regulator [unclassified Prochlorococcus]|uniref:LysR family transcriptional regulator n=1 Tax=unclassified Prochlorococcus TaxID=2627481 RepID=UPI000533B57F|nr:MULTISPECIES: LysR family transcriptional regulator [unclassified Prochlorococcus]KGG16916.1 putative methyl-accepting chemotaxis protein [Prochlorococcus sp. MIT 0602]KGG18109.1 putative methyl-accepting chemotaxis protein [Prochlorococcus sp. MIT 0603]
MSSSCSFRITRTAEDLAQTVTAISQRLIKLEQRLEALELQAIEPNQDQSDEEMDMLDGVDQLLQECKGILNHTSNDSESDECSLDQIEENNVIDNLIN